MNSEIQFILYQLPDEEGRVQVVIKDETSFYSLDAIIAVGYHVSSARVTKFLSKTP